MGYYVNLLINFLLLFRTPLLLACPQAETTISSSPVSSKNENSEEKLLTYDDLLEFVEEIEFGNLEKYSLDDLEWMVQLLVFFARNGVLPGQEEEMESVELHHVPPQREGGLFDFIELSPQEHAELDKYRRLRK